MLKVFVFLLASIAALAADNSWVKVGELKTGTELRIYKTGAKQPFLATFDEATDERLVVVIKNEQVAIDKKEIDRIDYRPPRPAGRIAKETRTTDTYSPEATAGPKPQGSRPGPGTSTTTSVGVQSKPDFETIYRRTSSTPPNKRE